ncbi:signal transduction histidine kinase [Nocardiopsis mwathae]|uniref:Oxygen sensor histidine kinase NreB n=1 Tax=Nocardiopsis mwathae TaxID=1472723 RepID=A0A7W9YM23_9ACTN|nr:sensor histidine kinase [Nocardiopsis mwathae]MBB6174046.1 signal transduction histidine kinase [Nocardiopsis mwathae]
MWPRRDSAVDGQAEAGSSTPPEPGHHREFRGWDACFTLVYAGAAVLGVAVPSAGPVWMGPVLVGLLALCYAVLIRPVVLRDDPTQALSPRTAAAIVLAAAVFLPLTGQSLVYYVLLLAVIPQCFMLLAPGWAVGCLLVFFVGLPSVVWWPIQGEPPLSILIAGTLMVASSLTLGVWIHQVLARSEERAQLLRELHESQREIARLSAERGALAERTRMAREIHDTLAQGFTSIITLTEAVRCELDTDPERARRHVDLVARTARENLAEARALVAGHAPLAAGSGSLKQALERITARLAEELDIDVTCAVTGEPTAFDAPLQVDLLRAAQESLANIRRHAEASRAEVVLRYGTDRVELVVRDNGRGFRPEDIGAGHGVPGMRRRAEEAGGTCTIDSRPGHGTEFRMEIPLMRTGAAP